MILWISNKGIWKLAAFATFCYCNVVKPLFYIENISIPLKVCNVHNFPAYFCAGKMYGT